MNQENRGQKGSPMLSRFNVALIFSIAIIAYFLLSEHRAHFIEYLPYLLLVACLFLHLFMHGGAHSHGEHSSSTDRSSKEDNNA